VKSLPCNDLKRNVGFEIEYAGVSLNKVAAIIKRLFGGQVIERNTAELEVADTEFGVFKVELDAVQVKRFAAAMRAEIDKADGDRVVAEKIITTVNDVASDLATKLVPMEIVAPPIPVASMHKVDDLRCAMLEEGAADTHSSFRYAFGLHINPEVKGISAIETLNIMRAFSVMSPWLVLTHKVDVTRRLSPFIDLYGEDYVNHIIEADYRPSFEELIKDYHRFNPTRNRALDMLPLFAEHKGDLVTSLYGPDEKINPRPTFHYRLPNCEVADPDWSLFQEWDIWQLIEGVAANPDCLAALTDLWRTDFSKINATALMTDRPHAEKIQEIIEEYGFSHER
jgi:hypothetical protein